MKIRSRLLCSLRLLIAITFIIRVAAAQPESIRPQNVNIASPNASSLGKVVDMPVSYHAGIPNVEIPIYEVSAGPLKLPVSLSYHASGLKVMEQASWVGAGWSLNAGGMITRTVRGTPDEVVNATSQKSYIGNKGFYNYLYVNDTQFNPTVLPYGKIPDYAPFVSGYKDGEPDLFTFNFGNYSGKFYFKPDTTIVFAPQQDIKVKPLFCGAGNPNCNPSIEYLYGWVLTTPDGVKYYFGKTLSNTTDVDPIENTNTYSVSAGASFSKTISSWFLYKVESPDSKFTINLTYSEEDYSYYTLSLYPLAFGYQGTSTGYDLAKNFMYGVRLNSITFPNGSLNFVASSAVRQDLSSQTGGLNDTDPTGIATNARALDRIEIINGTTCIRTFAFDYGYFYDNTHPLTGPWASWESTYSIHCDKKRLKLNSLTERTCDGSLSKPPHVFTYFDESSVPRTLSLAQDHWGFFNGATSNTQLMPAISINNGWTTLLGNANRDAAWPAMRAGSLRMVGYPTGGYSRFAFSNHSVYVQRTGIDSISVADVSASGTGQTSQLQSFSLSQTTTLKVLKGFTNSNVGSGNWVIKNVSTGLAASYTTLATTSTSQSGINYSVTIISMAAGSYQFYTTCDYSDSYHSTRGMLYKFTPTYSQFYNIPVGGLRLDSLISNPGGGSDESVQTFSYVDANGAAQGVLFSRPTYVSPAFNSQMKEQGGYPINTGWTAFNMTNGCPTYDASTYGFFYSASAILPMRSSQGNHFGYNQVKVTRSDGSFTIYKYTLAANPSDPDVCLRVIDASVCNDTAPSYPYAPVPFKFEQGELINKSVYNAAGTLLTENKYTNEWTYEPVGVPSLVTKSYGSVGLGTQYDLKTAKKTKVTEEERIFNPSTGLTPVFKKTETYFASPNHTLPTKVVVTDGATGKVLSDYRTTYTADLAFGSCTTTNTYDQKYADSVAYYQNLRTTGLAGCTDNSCRWQKWQYYFYSINRMRIVYFNNRSAFYSALNSCSNGSTTWNSANADLKALIRLRNVNILLPIESSAWRDGSLLESAYVTYSIFDSDVTRIYPSKYESLKSNKPLSSSAFAPFANSASTVSKDSKYLQEETYSYADGNIVEVTSKSGVVTSYLWGYNRVFPIAKAVGASYANLLAAYNSTSPLTNLRTSSYLAGALVTVYIYDPLVGMISQTDPNGVTTTYGYDPLGRFQFTKDNAGNLIQKTEYNYNAH